MQKRYDRLVTMGMIVCMAIGLLFVGYISYCHEAPNLKLQGDYLDPIEEGWTYHWDNVATQQPITLPDTVMPPEGAQKLILRNRFLGEEIRGAALWIRTSQQALRVTVDNKEIYSYQLSPNRKFGKTLGSAWHVVKLPNEYVGKEVEIELMSHYKTYKGRANIICIGNKSSIAIQIMQMTTLPYTLSVFIGIIGAVLIMCAIGIREMRTQWKCMFHLGCFVLMASIWSIVESERLQFYVSDQYVIHSLGYLALTLMPIPILSFMNTKYELRESKLYILLSCCHMINFIRIIIMQMLDIGDFFETLLVTYFLIGVTMFLIGYTIVRQVKDDRNITVNFSIGYCILVLSGIISILDSYNYNVYDNAKYFRIGVIIYLALLGIDTAKMNLQMRQETIKAQALAEIAYTDVMTNLRNRSAFQVYMEELDARKNNIKNIWLIIFDLNNLKITNDHLGHHAGDEIIVDMAKILKVVFEPIGCAFRTGGDEFVVILENITEKEITKYEKDLNKLLKMRNEKAISNISVAYGYDRYNANEDHNLYDLYMRADKKMYINKYKQKNLR